MEDHIRQNKIQKTESKSDKKKALGSPSPTLSVPALLWMFIYYAAYGSKPRDKEILTRNLIIVTIVMHVGGLRDRDQCREDQPHHHHHRSLTREGRWGTTDDLATSFLHFFHVLHCPLGLTELQACPFLDVVFPPLPLSVLSSSPFHCAL